MAKNQIDYQINFTANTTTAKAALSDLAKALDSIKMADIGSATINSDLHEGAKAASILRAHLESATNVNTGKLNLNVLSKSLKTSGTSLSQLSQKLLDAGQMGQQTFTAFANAIAKTEIPIKRVDNLMTNFAVTLKNTAKWQISSTIIHGLQSGLSGAVSYARNLNESLTDISIVTGRSVEQMASFAGEANKAAKSLGSTTNAYAKASLIYYQQGDEDSVVKKKTDITMKATNASSESSPEEMSDYLTAVWNSYKVGEKELESTVDVMAALGAKTATSMEEIAAAMQKVAAVGNTVGVGFNQMSSIIATVSSVTRQSAESIGTAYKTIFARIGDLKLGKTDEDGVGLGVVSSQVESLGFKILDANGELRDMGTVVSEIGNKWETMDKATQTALAQAIAGKRQYTQLVALFDNWDMFNQNMFIAENSEGSLQKMQDTYAAGWEFAANKVQASLEEIYNKIIKGKDVVNVFKIITSAIEGLSTAFDSFGGIGGILLNIGNIAFKVFQNQIGVSIQTAVDKFNSMSSTFKSAEGGFGVKLKSAFGFGDQSELNQYINNLKEVQRVSQLGSSSEELFSTNQLMDAKIKLVSVSKQLSSDQFQGFDTIIKQLSTESNEVTNLTEEYQRLEKVNLNIAKSTAQNLIRQKASDEQRTYSLADLKLRLQLQKEITKVNSPLADTSIGLSFKGLQSGEDALTRIIQKFKEISLQAHGLESANYALMSLSDSAIDGAGDIDGLKQHIEGTVAALSKVGIGGEELENIFREVKNSDLTNFESTLGAAMSKINIAAGTARNQVFRLREVLEGIGLSTPQIDELINTIASLGDAARNQAISAVDWNTKITKTIKDIGNASTAIGQKVSKGLSNTLAYITATVTGITSMSNAISVFGDKSATTASKISAVSGVVTNLISGFKSARWTGLILAGVGSLIGIFVGLEEAAKKAEIARKKIQFEDAQKQSEKVKEELDSITELLSVYNELLSKKASGENVDKDLAEAAKKLAEAYGVTSTEVMNLTGNYKELLTAAQEAAAAEAATNLAHAKAAVEAQKVVIQNMGDEDWTGEETNGNINLDNYQSTLETYPVESISDKAAKTILYNIKTNFPTEILDSDEDLAKFLYEQFDIGDLETGEDGKNIYGILDEGNNINIKSFAKELLDKQGLKFKNNSNYYSPPGQEHLDEIYQNNVVAESMNSKISSLEKSGYRGANVIQDSNLKNKIAFSYIKTGVSKEDFKQQKKVSSDYALTEDDQKGADVSLEQIAEKIGATNIFATSIGDKSAQILLSENDTVEYKLEVYDKINQMMAEMTAAGLTDDPMYAQLSLLSTEMSTKVAGYEAAQKYFVEAGEKSSAVQLINKTTSKEQIGSDNYMSFASYEKERTKLENIAKNTYGLKDDVEIQAFIEESIRTNEELMQYERIRKAALETFGKDNENFEKALTIMSPEIEKYGTDLFTDSLLWSMMSGDPSNFENVIHTYSDFAAARFAADEALTNVNQVKSLTEMLKEDYTTEDLEKMRALSSDWKKDFGVSFSEFILMPLEEQKKMARIVYTKNKTIALEQSQLAQDEAMKLAQSEIYEQFSLEGKTSEQKIQMNNDKPLFDLGKTLQDTTISIEDKIAELDKAIDSRKSQDLDTGFLETLRLKLGNVIITTDDVAFTQTLLASAAISAADALNEIASLKGDDLLQEGQLLRNQEILQKAKDTLSQEGDLTQLGDYSSDRLKEIFPGVTNLSEISLEMIQTALNNIGSNLTELYYSNAQWAGDMSSGWEEDLESPGDYNKTFELVGDNTDKQTIAFLEEQGVNTHDEQGNTLSGESVTVTLSADSLNALQQTAQDIGIKAEAPMSEEQRSIQEDLDTTGTRQQAITSALTANDESSRIEAANNLREAYKGSNKELWEQAEAMAKAVEAGEDLTKCNKFLTSSNIKSTKEILKMTKSQRNQYKQMLKTNGVTVDGYESLDEYIQHIDAIPGLYKEWENAAKKATGEISNLDEVVGEDESGKPIVEDDFVKKILPDKFDDISDELIDLATKFDGDITKAGKMMWDSEKNVFTESGNQLLSAMGFTKEQIITAQNSMVAEIGENGNVGDIDILSIFADADVDPTQFDTVITLLNNAMAKVEAACHAKGIELEPGWWTPIVTLGELGVGKGSKAKADPLPSGGGGGGGGGKKTKKEFIKNTDEIERYHQISEVLTRTKAELDKIDKLKDRTYGGNHIKQLDDEIKKLKENITEQQKYRDEINSYLAQDKAMIQSHGAQLDQEGNIYNYKEMMQKWIDDYNAAIQKFNNSKQDEGDQLALDDSEEIFNQRKEDLEQYEETLKLVEDEEQTFLDLQNKLSEAALEKITYAIEIKTEINEGDLAILEYFTKKYEDSLKDQGALMENLLNQASEYEDNLSAVTTAMAELNTQHTNGTLNDADYKEGMDQLRESALEYAEALLDIQKQLEETYENALSMATEEIANHTEKIQGATDALASYIEIMGLLGRGANFGELTKFYEEQYKSNLANLNVQKQYLDSLLEQKKYFESKGSLSEAEKKQYEALQDTIRETHATVLENTQATLQSMQDAYNNSISAIFKDLDSAIAGTAGSIANLADQYGYYQEEQERYVSAAKELYEVSKLNRQIEDSIASATTSSSKQMLKALQERIKLQSESNDLSQYDIDMMNLQYKLALAKIALDEAQDSKDIVRLTRDENGNFAYQYTADQSKVSEAQQNYEDTLQEINDLASGRISELEQSFLDAQQKYLESAQEIALDTTLTAEERALKLQQLQQRYNDTLLYIQEQYNNASSNLLTNQEVISDHYGQSLVNSTGQASTQINAQMQSMIENTQAYIDSLNEAINGEKGVNSTWQSYINNLAEVATALTGMDTGTAQERIEALYKALSSSAEEYAEANKAVSDAASGSIDIIEDSLSGVNDATEKWNEHAAALEIVILHYERLAQAAQAAIQAAAGASASPASSPTPPTKYATGGLNTTTGLAWLDGTPSAPEMVLNPHDTQNILKAAKLSSNNSQMIDSIGAILSDQLSSMYSVLNSSYHTDTYRAGTTISELKQLVEIHAEFPNVQDRNEIEEAFDNLINRASQYVNQK